MKSFLKIIAALSVLGLLLGIVATYAGTKPFVRVGQEAEAAEMIARVKEVAALRNDPNAKLPLAVCNVPDFDFGMMDPLTVGKHTFVIENHGKETLVIQGGHSSCKCTLSDLKEAIIPPGDSQTVTLTWNSGHAKTEFQQSAIVRTNDPSNPEIRLSVRGVVRAVLGAHPTAVNFDRLIPETMATAQFVLYSQVWEEMKAVRIESTNEHVQAELSTEPFEGAFARDNEIRNARSGLVINLSYDGTATRGPLSGRLRVFVEPPENWSPSVDETATSVSRNAGDVETMPANTGGEDELSSEEKQLRNLDFPTLGDGTVLCEIPFHGTVVRRVSLYGKAVNGDGEINLGKLHPSKTEGASWTIVGRIRGDERPNALTVTAEGIPGLAASVESFDSTKAQNSFRINLKMTEKLRPAIYNRQQAGKLTILTPGMPAGDDQLELPIILTVIEN